MVWVISWKLGWMQIYDTVEHPTQTAADTACEAAKVKYPDCTAFAVEEVASLDALMLERIMHGPKGPKGSKR